MAVAGRLAKDPSITVAVLEAGMNVEDLPEVVQCLSRFTTNPLYSYRNQGVCSGSHWNRKGQDSKLGLSNDTTRTPGQSTSDGWCRESFGRRDS